MSSSAIVARSRTILRVPAGATIGVVSDTHGWVHPSLAAILEGCDLIVHGGDVCGWDVLLELESMAPVVAVRGNNDENGPCALLPLTAAIEFGGRRIAITHIFRPPPRRASPVLAGAAMVIFGHSHAPHWTEHDGVAFFNPGAAGKRRFRAVPTAATLRLVGDRWDAHFVRLDDRAAFQPAAA